MSRLLEKVSRALEDHRERHRPSGFAFALSDSIDALSGEQWDALAAGAGGAGRHGRGLARGQPRGQKNRSDPRQG